MFNPEFFLGAYKSTAGAEQWLPAALFTDTPPADVDTAAETVIMERRPLLLIPVPSEQQWASAAWAGQPVEPQTPRAQAHCVVVMRKKTYLLCYKRTRHPPSEGHRNI